MLGYVAAIALGYFVVERCFPAWKLPFVRGWPLRVIAINLAQLGVVLLAGVTWEVWLGAHSLLHLGQHLSPIAGGALAYFVSTFVFYWWHRWRHEVDALWLFHQTHHSAQRIEVVTSFYKHPVEMMANSIIGSVLVYAVLGLSLESGAIYTACCAVGEFFYHANVRTPHWIGYVFQRPEMHRIHHQYARHRNNYGDITWWDMLFGTFENPREGVPKCGFDDDQEQRLLAMLVLRDVHAPSERKSGVKVDS